MDHQAHDWSNNILDSHRIAMASAKGVKMLTKSLGKSRFSSSNGPEYLRFGTISLLLIVLASLFVHTEAAAATIYAYVRNVSGSYVSGAKVKLYLPAGGYKIEYTNPSGYATFALLDYGTYTYEVFYQGVVEEFWGSDEDFYLGNPTLTRYFDRNWPYRYSDNFPLGSVPVGQQVTMTIAVKNNLTFTRNVSWMS